jgi:hypothetical protein
MLRVRNAELERPQQACRQQVQAAPKHTAVELVCSHDATLMASTPVLHHDVNKIYIARLQIARSALNPTRPADA